MRSETITTLVLVNLAGIMERSDESLLPAVYKEVGEELHADPTRLGSLTLLRSVVQSLCYPLAAYLSIRHNRTHAIALGAFLWAAATFAVGISSTFAQVAISRGLNGIGLAIVTPAIQTLVADSTDDSNRGTAFGWLQMTSNLGSIIGGLLAILIASSTPMGIPGWRFAFHLVALLSIIIAILVALFATDPRSINKAPRRKGFKEEVKEVIEEAKTVVKVPSFRILVGQGVFGMFPWSALSFAAMWLELTGLSHEATATIVTLYNVAASLGALFGGKMGDILAKRLPNTGRIMLSQISSGSAIPIGAILMLGLAAHDTPATIYGFVFFVMGFFISWNAPATNNPIFAEIVPESARTSIYALDRSLECILASFAPPVVGILAQHVYGYKPLPTSGPVADRENAASLGKALYTAIGIPMAICCGVYSFLYCTYPRDRDRARILEQERISLINEVDAEENEQRRLLLSSDDRKL